MRPSEKDVTQMLADSAQGDPAALDTLMPLVYDELRQLARRYLRRERPGHTLQATALVHEAYLKLIDQKEVRWQNRAHFLGIAAEAMRRILVDHARRHQAIKRGRGDGKPFLDQTAQWPAQDATDLLALDDALKSLSSVDPQKSRIVELRFFGGLTIDETAEVLGVSTPTVERGWRNAKLWIQRELLKGNRHDA